MPLDGVHNVARPPEVRGWVTVALTLKGQGVRSTPDGRTAATSRRSRPSAPVSCRPFGAAQASRESAPAQAARTRFRPMS